MSRRNEKACIALTALHMLSISVSTTRHHRSSVDTISSYITQCFIQVEFDNRMTCERCQSQEGYPYTWPSEGHWEQFAARYRLCIALQVTRMSISFSLSFFLEVESDKKNIFPRTIPFWTMLLCYPHFWSCFLGISSIYFEVASSLCF